MRASAIAVMGMLMLGPVAVAQTPRAGEARTLSAADYAEIHQLYARYGYSLDKVVDNGRMFAELFTTDGVYVDVSGAVVTGRDRLAQYAWDRGTRSPFRWTTYLSSIMIEPSSEGAYAKAYYLTMNMNGQQPTSLSPGGVFVDELVKTAEGWRFKRKQLVAPDAPVPASMPAAFK